MKQSTYLKSLLAFLLLTVGAGTMWADWDNSSPVYSPTNGQNYATLKAAFDGLKNSQTAGTAETPVTWEIDIYSDVTLGTAESSNIDLPAYTTLNIVPQANVTLSRGTTHGRGKRWFLVNQNSSTLNIGSDNYTLTIEGDGSTTKYCNSILRREAGVITLNKVTFYNVVCESTAGGEHGYLYSTKATSNGYCHLKNVAVSNCTTTTTACSAFFSSQATNDDALFMEDSFNFSECTGKGVYAAKRIRLGAYGGNANTSITALTPIIINWGGATTSGTKVIVKVASSDAWKTCFVLSSTAYALDRNNYDLEVNDAYVANTTQGVAYIKLADAISAVAANDVLSVLKDVDITARIQAASGKPFSIVAGADNVTINKASSFGNNTLFFLANSSSADLTIGSAEHRLIIDGGNYSTTNNIVESTGQNMYITNVTFKNFTTSNEKGIIRHENGGTCHLKDVSFENCTNSATTGGIIFGGRDQLWLDGITFTNCTSTANIYCEKYFRLESSATLTNKDPITVLIKAKDSGLQIDDNEKVIENIGDYLSNFSLLNDGYTLTKSGTAAILSKKYTITPNVAENGTLSVSPTAAGAGETITVTATPNDSYTLTALKYNDGSDHDISIETTPYTFEMPAANVTVSATFTAPTTQYMLTIGEMTNGKIQISEADAATTQYDANTELTLTAVSTNDSYEFDKWTSDGTTELTANEDNIISINGSTMNVKMTKDFTVVATFKEKSTSPTIYAITKADATNGSFTVNVSDAEVTEAASDATVTITVTPNTGYEVNTVTVVKTDETTTSVTVNGEGNSRTFTMPTYNVTVTVTFKAKTYNVTIGSHENGNITINSEAVNTNTTAQFGSTVNVALSNDSGYEFTSISIKGANNSDVAITTETVGSSYTFTMPNSDVTVSATFTSTAPATYTITKAATTNGTITAKVGEEGVTEAAEGATVVITATPSEGYQLASLTYTPEGESAVDIKSAMQFTMPAKAVTITATFEEIPATTYAITKANATNGSFTVSSETAAADATVTITTTPATGYEVDAVTTNVDGTVPAKSGTDDNVYTFTMPTEAVTVTVTFKQINYEINGLGDVTVSETKVGTVSVGEEKTTATYGETVTITATPEEGYQLTALKYYDGSEDHEFTLSSTPYTFVMPASIVTITATFELIPVTTYGVTVPTGLTGGTVASDKAEAAKDDKVTLTVTPDMTYELEDLKVNNGDVALTLGNDGKYSFIMPEGAVSISATFTAMNGLSAADGYVRGDGTNAGKSYTSPIQIVRKEGGAQIYGYITFPLNIPTGKVVKSATLRLTAKRVKGDRYINVYALDGNTAETATYTSLSEKIANPGTAIFSNYKVEGGNMDMTTDNIGNYNTISKWQNTFDLTDHLKSLGNVSNFGLLFERVSTSAADEIHFFTREQMPFVNTKNDVNIEFSKSLKRSDLVPQLTVTYGDPEYDVSIGTFAGGTVEADKTTVTAGETVTLTITPTDSHYQLTGLTVGGQTVTATQESNGTYTYSFAMPANDVTVEATFQAVASSYSVWNATTETGYTSLNAAFTALTNADTGATNDVELEVNADQTLTGRLTWSKAFALTITPTKDITIKGHKNGMWFLNNAKKSGDNVGVLNIGGGNYTITLDGQNNEFGYDVTKYEENGTIALTNVVFQNFNLNNAGHLVGSKASEGQMILDKVTFKNCTNPADAYIYKARVTNDRLVLKGYLNIDSDCPGTAIYAASETKSSGTTGRIKIDDDEFTASNTITIEWPGTKAEGIVVAIGTSTSNYGKFALTDAGWVLERKASNGDLMMALSKYSVNIDSASDGSVTPDMSEAAEDATVTLTVTPNDGYRLASLTVKIGSTTISTTAESDNTYTFTMPKGDVTVSATFEAIPASDYPVYDVTNSKGYASLNAAFTALTNADTGATNDVELEVNEDQTLTGRLTWSKAFALTITPTKDITIKGHKNGMWFLNNAKKSGDNVGVLNIGGGNYTITLDGQNNEFGYDVTKYEENGTIALTNVVFQNFNLNNAGHLVGSKASEGQMILDKVTFKNCTNPADAYIYKARVTNDRLVLKGYLNIDSDCPGTAIYAASETKTSGTTGRIKIDDDEFTASNTITIEWPGTKAEGIVVAIGTSTSNYGKFALTDADWVLERNASNGDLKLAKPVVPTAKIGDTTYENLTAALAAVQDGETITLTADQEVSSRINIESKSVTIKGATSSVKISRAEKYTNGLLFLTKDETAVLTLEDVTLDDGSIETTAAMIEAGNKGMTTLKNVTVQNSNTTASGVIVNKSNGQLTLNDVKFVGCKMIVAEASNIAARRAASTDTSKGIVFVGTNNVKLVGNNTFENCPTHIYVEKKNSLDGSEANHTTPIKVMVDSNREAGVLVKEGHTDQYELVGIDGMELVQQGADVYMVSATGIRTINAGSLTGDHKIYDMRGRKLTTITEKGVYIIDGKKVVVK